MMLATLFFLVGVFQAVPAIPAPAPAPSDLPLVESNKLRRILTRSDLLVQANKLQDFAYAPGAGGTRGFGGQGHNATINYIYDTLKATGYYNVEFQPFTQRYAASTGNLTVDGDGVVFYAARGSPKANKLKGELAAVKGEGCNVEDFPPAVNGRIAVLARGNCTVTLKSQLSKGAGATAVLIYNNVPGTVLDGRVLDVPDLVPTGALSNKVGLDFISRLNAGETLRAELSIDGFAEQRLTYNVLATTKVGDQNNIVVLGAHSDSVPLGPGINDNGSGSIGLLEVALKLTNFKVNNAIRFAWWSAEEFGLLGAQYYVDNLADEENIKIRMNINTDMIGSPNYIFGVYDGDGSTFGLTGPPGSAEIEKTLQDYFLDVGRSSVPTAFTGRSDYGPFLAANIPAGGLFTGAEGVKTEEEQKLFGGKVGDPYDVNYHQPGDTVKNLDLGALIVNTKAVADSVAKYGRSLEGFPARTLLGEGARAGAVQWSKGTHGKNHDHSTGGGCGDGLY